MAKEKYPVVARLAFFGVLSGGLYALLYVFAGDIVAASEKVRAGDKIFAGVPVGIAFLFSFAHGKFTSHFWECLGCRSKCGK